MPARKKSSNFHWSSRVKPKTLQLGDGRSITFRSSFEAHVAEDLEKHGAAVEYETERLPYVTEHRYTPDFKLGSIRIECKGYFEASDRTKLLAVKVQHPEVDIRLLFQNPARKLRKGSKTSYAQWAEKHGFPWARGPTIPEEWYAGS